MRLLALVAALVLGGAAGALLVNAGRPLGPGPVARFGTPPTARVVVTAPAAPKRITHAATHIAAPVTQPTRVVAPVAVRPAPQLVKRTVAPAPKQTPHAPTSTGTPLTSTTKPKTAPRLTAPKPTTTVTASPLPHGLAKKAGHVPPGQAKKLRAGASHVPPGRAKKDARTPASHVPPGQAKKQHGGH
ncbi:MAG: hypothetical protein ACRDLM_04125 [Gaiellaceae bacterium]